MKKIIIILMIILMSSIVYGVSTDNITAYYDFDSSVDINDSVGSADGTNNGADFTSDGIIDGAYNFVNANTDYVSIGDTGINTNVGTINMWIIVDTYDDFYSVYSTNDNGLIDEMFVASTTSGLYFYDGGSLRNYDQTPVGNWTMITLVWDGDYVTLYQNGTFILNETRFDTTKVVNDFVFGRSYNTDADRHFDGRIDEAGFWNRVLLASEISDLWNSGDGMTYNGSEFVPPAAPPINITTDFLMYHSFNSDFYTGSTSVDSYGVYNLTNTGTVNISGVIGDGRNFTGDVDNYFSYPSNPTPLQGDIEFTISTWMYVPSSETSSCVGIDPIVSFGTNALNNAVHIVACRDSSGECSCTDNNARRLDVDFYTAGPHSTVTDMYNFDEWFMATITYNTSHVKYYVNSVLKDTVAYAGTLNIGSGAFQVGGRIGIPSHRAEERLDEVGIWSRELNSTDITFLYNSGSGFTYNGSEFMLPSANTPPNITYINLTPLSPDTLDNLIGFCNATDEDADPLTYNYTWNKNGVGYTSGTTTIDYLTILDASVTAVDYDWDTSPPFSTHNATAIIDGNFTTYGTPWNGQAKFYANYTLPSIVSSVIWEVKTGAAGGTNYTNITLGSDYLNGTLRVELVSNITDTPAYVHLNVWNYTLNDWDMVYDLQDDWYIYDQRVYVNITTISLGYNETSKGDNWSIMCWADDGTDVSDPLESSNVTISGVAPVIVNASISPATAYTDTILLGWCNATDYDLDTLMYNFTWYKNGTSISTSNTSYFTPATQVNVGNLSSSNFGAGDNISIECLTYDGIFYSDRLNSSQIEILESAPTVNSVTLSPSVPYVNETILGYCNGSDVDVDAVSYYYKWFKNNVFNNSGYVNNVGPYNVTHIIPTTFENGTSSCTDVANATDGDWDTAISGCSPTPFVYLEAIVLTNYTLPSGLDNASIKMKTYCFSDSSTPQNNSFYWNYTLGNWTRLTSLPCTGTIEIQTVDIPSDGLTNSPLRLKHGSLSAMSLVKDFYDANVTFQGTSGYYSTLYETPTTFENGTSSCTDVANATDANWTTYIAGCTPAPFVYLEAIALTNYTLPTGVQNATITFKTYCFSSGSTPTNGTLYWNYSSNDWEPLYEHPCDGTTQIPILDVPLDGMTSSPLRFKHRSWSSATSEPLQFYDANVTFNGYTTGYPNYDNININNISSVDTSVGDLWKVECTAADGENSTPVNSSIAQVRGYSQIVFEGKGATTSDTIQNFSFSLTNETTTYYTITNYSDVLDLVIGNYSIVYNSTGWSDGTDRLDLTVETNTTKTLLFYNTELLIVPTRTYDGANISGFTVNVSNAVYDNVTYVAGNSINFSLSNGTYTFTFNKTGWLDFSEDLYFSGTTYAPNLSQSEVNIDAINSFTSVAIANYSIEFYNGTYSGNYTVDGYNTSIGLPPNNYTVIGSVAGYADYITTLNMTALDNKSMTLSFSPGTLEVRPNQTISESPISGFTVTLTSVLLNTSVYSSGPAINISVLSGNYSIVINKSGYINHTNTTEITTGYKLIQPQMFQSSLIVNAVKIVTGEVLNNFGVELDNGTETFYQYMTGYNGTLNIPAGNYTYTANKTSYNSDVGTINITAGETAYKTFYFGDMTMYVDTIDLFDGTNITGFTVNVNRSGYSETKYATGGNANFSLVEGIYSVFVNKSGYINYYNNTYYEDGITRPGISRSKLNLLVRPIFSATTLTDYNVTNVNTSTTHYPNPVTGLTSMFLNTSNYTFTLMSPGFVDTNFTYETLAGVISNYTATINGVFNLSFIDEDTLGAFNMSSFLTMDGYVYCGNNISQSLVYTNESPTTFNLSIGCELDKLRFVLTYGDENDTTTQETYYRTFILEDLTQGIYLVDLTHTSVILNTFKIFSLFDNFDRPRMIIRKGLENSTPQIIGDYFDAEAKMTAYLIDFDEYTLTIESDNQPNRNLGNYIPDTAGEKTIRLFDITLDKYPAGFTSQVFYSIGLLNVTEITPLLAASYVDTTNLTISTKFVVYNRSRIGNILYEQIDTTQEHDYTFPLAGVLQNTTVIGVLYINYNGTQYEYQQAFLVDQEIEFSFKDYISSGWLDWFITLLLSFLALMFTIPTASWGSLIIIGIGLFLKIVGLYSLGYGIIVLGLLIATIKFFTEKA